MVKQTSVTEDLPQNSGTLPAGKKTKMLATRVANTLHENKAPYSLYGLADATVLGSTLIKFLFELAHSTEGSSVATNAMQDWLYTPEGLITSVASIVPMAIFSAVANHYSTSKEATSKAIYRGWQSCRDGVKGLRNAYRGTRSTFTALSLLSYGDLRYILLPAGLVLGVLSLTNRVWNRDMVNKRKDMMDANLSVVKQLDTWGTLTKLTKLPSEDELKAHKNTYLIITEPDTVEATSNESGATDANIFALYFINHKGDPEKIALEETAHVYVQTLLDELKDTSFALSALTIEQFETLKTLDIEAEWLTSATKENYTQIALNEHEIQALSTAIAGHPELQNIPLIKPKKVIRPSVLEWYTVLPNTAPRHYLTFLSHMHAKVKTGEQSSSEQTGAYFSAAFGGFVDGLYMFMGIVALSALSPYALILVAIISAFFSALCIFTRIHEEKDYQRALIITQQKAELALIAKELEVCIAEFNTVKYLLSQAEAHGDEGEIKKLREAYLSVDKAVYSALGKLNYCRNKLHKTAYISTTDAVLVGLRHGLYAYIALLCSVFAAAVISVMFFATPIPQIVVLFTIAAGIAMLAGFTMYSFSCARAYEAHQAEEAQEIKLSLDEFIEEKKNKPAEHLFTDLPAIDPLQEGENIDSIYQKALGTQLPVWYLMNWFDVIRAFFSGLMKGPKLVDFSFNFIEEPGHHEIDSPFVMVTLAFAAIVGAIIYAFRMCAKWRKELDDDHPIFNTTTEKHQPPLVPIKADEERELASEIPQCDKDSNLASINVYPDYEKSINSHAKTAEETSLHRSYVRRSSFGKQAGVREYINNTPSLSQEALRNTPFVKRAELFFRSITDITAEECKHTVHQQKQLSRQESTDQLRTLGKSLSRLFPSSDASLPDEHHDTENVVNLDNPVPQQVQGLRPRSYTFSFGDTNEMFLNAQQPLAVN